MRIYEIRYGSNAGEHSIYEGEKEFKEEHPGESYNKHWWTAKPLEWVKTTDGYIVQLLALRSLSPKVGKHIKYYHKMRFPFCWITTRERYDGSYVNVQNLELRGFRNKDERYAYEDQPRNGSIEIARRLIKQHKTPHEIVEIIDPKGNAFNKKILLEQILKDGVVMKTISSFMEKVELEIEKKTGKSSEENMVSYFSQLFIGDKSDKDIRSNIDFFIKVKQQATTSLEEGDEVPPLLD